MKKYLKVIVMAVFVLVTGLNVYKAQTNVKLSDAQLRNVEALATGEVIPDECNGCSTSYNGSLCCIIVIGNTSIPTFYDYIKI